jgi:Plasmid replication region DNA-binding N-term
MNEHERQSLRNELETMRASGARRQELSQHACKRLFFDFGIRPSMATVRDLTQTGSASDIPKDIDAFWSRIRDASRVRIEGGAIPEVLQERAGELLGQLFQEAMQLASASFAEERDAAQATIDAVESRIRDAEVRYATIDEALRRSEARAEAVVAQNSVLAANVASSREHDGHERQSFQALIYRLESEKDALTRRIESEHTANAALRERIDVLNAELRQNTEHYAQQIKDAVSEAERRVKPMLVELDSLRGMAATYQAGVRQASQKEFEFIQQLGAAKARADRLDGQLRNQSDELDALTIECGVLRSRAGMSQALGQLLYTMAMDGRMSATEIEALGTDVDGFVDLPARCTACGTGEPELSEHDGEFELSCPDCERSSGAAPSRLSAVARFVADDRVGSLQVVKG